MNQEPKYKLSNVLRKKYTERISFRTVLLAESDSTDELLLEAAEELEHKDELLLEAAEELEHKDEVIEKNNLEIYELNKVIGEMDDIIERQEDALNRIYHYGYYPENK